MGGVVTAIKNAQHLNGGEDSSLCVHPTFYLHGVDGLIEV